MPRPDVSVVIVTYDAARFLAPFLESLAAQRDVDAEIIVVDNASRDDSRAMVDRLLPGAVSIASAVNLGFAGGCNLGAARARSDVLLFLNPDIRMPPDAIGTLARAIAGDPAVGAIGPKLRFPDGRIQCAGGILGPNGHSRHRGWGEQDLGQYDVACGVDYVPGAALAIRRAHFLALDGFHDGYFPGFFEDVELCMRLRRQGLEVRYVPAPALVHLESQSMHRHYDYWLHRNRLLFLARNPGARAGLGAETRSFGRALLAPLGRALVGRHPRRVSRILRRLPPLVGGHLAGALQWLRSARR